MSFKISARDLRMDYAVRGASERVRVLEGFDLDVRDGEFLSVLGPSGCGKSTFCLLYTSPSPRDRQKSRMPSSA